MGILQTKIDFVAFVAVSMANPNGDPLNGNSPRTDYSGLGEISDVCVKRKLRNRMQDLGQAVFVQSADRCDDGYGSLSERASTVLGKAKEFKDSDAYAQKACRTWLDVRSFGQVFAFKDKDKDSKGVSVGVRGPVSIHQCVSISPVQVEDMQITKSVNGESSDKGRSSDTMGMKHFVRFGFYKIKGSINVQLAQKTGFTEEDAELLKECLRTLFVNDASAARPEGSMEVVKLYWFRHNCKDGQYSSARVHRSLQAELIASDAFPTCAEDYRITLEPLDGLEPEILNGV